MTDLTVAQTIWYQLGVARAMMGMAAPAGDETSLHCRVKAGRKITHLRITLTAEDLYDIRYFRSGRQLHIDEGVYAADMVRFIEGFTGLAGRLI